MRSSDRLRRSTWIVNSLALFASVVVAVLFLLPGIAAATTGSANDAQIVITGSVVVTSDQTVGDVVIFNGPATIDGRVDGSVVVFNGDVTISGSVRRDVVSFNGSVVLAETASVGGNLVTRTAPEVSPGAQVDGTIKRVNSAIILGKLRWISAIAVWIAVTVSTFVFGVLLLLFGPRAAERVATVATSEVGPSVGWGLGLFFGIPVVSVIALVTIVGIPFGIGMLFGLGLLYTLGYVAAGFALGRVLVKQPANRFLAFLVGWGIVRVASIVPFLAGFVWFAAIAYGLGIVAVAARRTGRGTKATMIQEIPLPPAPTA